MSIRKQYRAILNRTNGYAAQGRRLLPSRSPNAAQRFWVLAQAIAARYSALERRWPAMAMVFGQPDRAVMSASHSYHITHPSLFVNPRVLLRLLVSHRTDAQRAAADRIPAQALGRVGGPMILAATSGPKQGVQEQDDVIWRIVLRAVRDENTSQVNVRPRDRSSGPVAQVATGQNAASAQSMLLARVYRHTATRRDEAPDEAVARTKREGTSAASGRDIPAAAAVLPPLDITRITDQVVQALDRRIVAHRERMGRG